MKTWLIGLLCVLAGGALIYWGIKTKSLPKILAGVAAVLGGILGATIKKNSDLKTELKAKDAEIAERKKTTEVVKDVQKQIKDIEEDKTEQPQKVEPPASGDSAGRLDRLRRL